MAEKKPLLAKFKKRPGVGGVSGRWGTARAALRSRQGFFGLTSEGQDILYGDMFEKAAALIDQAVDGKGIPPELIDRPEFEDAVKAAAITAKLQPLFDTASVILVLLSFFEVPLWCRGDLPVPCGDLAHYKLNYFPRVPRWLGLIIEAICIGLLGFQLSLRNRYRGWSAGHRLHKSFGMISGLAVMAGDVIVSGILLALFGPAGYPSVRPGQFARIIVLGGFNADVRKSFDLVVGVVGRFLEVGVLIILYIGLFTWMGRVLFLETPEGEKFLPTIKDAFGNFLYLFTAVNNPAVWMPAYESFPLSSVFFVVYLVIGIYFLAGVLFATVYAKYKEKLADDIATSLAKRALNLKAAFKALDVQNAGTIGLNTMCTLLTRLRKYIEVPLFEPEELRYMFLILDKSGDMRIDEGEFEDVISVICLRFERVQDTVGPIERYFPGLFNNSGVAALRDFVKGHLFNKIIFGILVFNFVIIAIETELDAIDSPYQPILQAVEVALGWVYLAEMLVKIVSLGTINYWAVGMNRFDAIVTVAMIVVEVLLLTTKDVITLKWLRYILVLQLLRLVRGLEYVRQFEVVVKTGFRIIPALLPLLKMVFFFMMLYNVFGVTVFGGLMTVGDPRLDGTMYRKLGYISMNFNDFPTGMITVFNLGIGHHWNFFMQAYVKVTGSEWTRLYFASFFILAVSFTLKLVTAFVLQGYLSQSKVLEDERQKAAAGIVQNDIQPLGAPSDLRIAVGSSTSLSNVELLKDILSNEVKAATLRRDAKKKMAEDKKGTVAGEGTSSDAAAGNGQGGAAEGGSPDVELRKSKTLPT